MIVFSNVFDVVNIYMFFNLQPNITRITNDHNAHLAQIQKK